MSKPHNYYVDNEKLHEAMTEYHHLYQESLRNGTEKPRASNYIGECIWMIANKLAYSANYRNYSYREEMISDAIENVVQYALHNYDPEKTQNPFSYFTTIINYAFIRRIEEEKKQQYIKHKNIQNLMTEVEMQMEMSSGSRSTSIQSSKDNTNPAQSVFADPHNIIESFETMMRKKAERKAARKAKKNE